MPSLEDLAKRVRRLEDIEAIKQIIIIYGKGSDDHHNVDVMLPLFTEDGVLDVGSGYGRYEGREALREFLTGPAEEIIRWSIHYMLSPVIEVAEDGRTAHAFWYLWEVANMEDPRTKELEAMWIGGTYDSDLVKEADGQWRFKEIRLKMEFMSPYSEGWVKSPFHDFGLPTDGE
ncbi:MAG: nuclear transport factor 2 family protein [Acidobacteria bacterium]|nr:nuclear transport factor 2 family protein [Acidobacteriota bacterium]